MHQGYEVPDEWRGCHAERLRVLEATGALRRTIEIWTHQLSIQPGVLSESAD